MSQPHAQPAIEPVETIVVDHHRVACDGGGGALGHPKVWLELGEEGRADCPYCGRAYIERGGPADRGAASSQAA